MFLSSGVSEIVLKASWTIADASPTRAMVTSKTTVFVTNAYDAKLVAI
jgi:hypothetical protein